MSQIELVGEAYQAVHIFIRKCLFMNRPSLACKFSVVWIFDMIVNMKLQYLASMIKVKKQLSNRQPEKTTAWENGGSTEQAPAASTALSTVPDQIHKPLHNYLHTPIKQHVLPNQIFHLQGFVFDINEC